MQDLISKITDIGIVPVIKIDNVKDAVPLAQALADGGLPVAEVTFRTSAAKESIEAICKALPDMLVGAGTVITTEQVDQAVEAGAKFIVSPGLNPNIVRHCQKKGIPILPGTSNPSDVEAALELGLSVVKFFPAEAAGGLNMIKSIAAPYTSVKFMPTGGISAKNINDYLAFDKIIACGGSWMVNADLINAGEFDKITELTRQAIETVMGFELAHIGINAENEDEAMDIAKAFSAFFAMPLKAGNSSIFSGTAVEVMKQPYLGKNGHIAIKTNSVRRAVNYLTRKGFEMDESTAKHDAKGNMIAIYGKKEIGGFAVHLLQKK